MISARGRGADPGEVGPLERLGADSLAGGRPWV
jgi:hypothetical protein